MIFDHAEQRVIKFTLPGFYGRHPRTRLNGVAMRPGKTLEYLDRLAFHNDLFEDDTTVLGIEPD